MSKSIQKEMNEQIDAATWLDEESKIMSKDKLNSMRIFIGFPEWYKDKKVVTKFYKGVRSSRHFTLFTTRINDDNKNDNLSLFS